MRCPSESGFYPLALAMWENKCRYSLAEKREMQRDLSLGIEHFPIPLVETLDDNGDPLLPRNFAYINGCMGNPPAAKNKGCGCTGPCHLNPTKCSCIINNYNQKIPYILTHEKLPGGKKGKAIIIMANPTKPACECSPLCGCACNETHIMRHAQEGMHALVEVRDVPGKGKGVFAQENLVRGQIVCIYAGRVVEAEALIVPHDDLGVEDEMEYLIEVEGDGKLWGVDAAKIGNIGRLINSTCKPNVYLTKIDNGHKYPLLVFVVIESIKTGKEILWKYDRSGKKSKFRCDDESCCGKKKEQAHKHA